MNETSFIYRMRRRLLKNVIREGMLRRIIKLHEQGIEDLSENEQYLIANGIDMRDPLVSIKAKIVSLQREIHHVKAFLEDNSSETELFE